MAALTLATLATRFGSWHEHVKSNNGTSSADDFDLLVSVLRTTNQSLYGLDVTDCTGLMRPLLHAAAGTGIGVFAVMLALAAVQLLPQLALQRRLVARLGGYPPDRPGCCGFWQRPLCRAAHRRLHADAAVTAAHEIRTGPRGVPHAWRHRRHDGRRTRRRRSSSSGSCTPPSLAGRCRRPRPRRAREGGGADEGGAILRGDPHGHAARIASQPAQRLDQLLLLARAPTYDAMHRRGCTMACAARSDVQWRSASDDRYRLVAGGLWQRRPDRHPVQRTARNRQQPPGHRW